VTATDPLAHCSDVERACVERFITVLRGACDVREVWLFGSFARGDAWSRRMPMNSDIDLLVVTGIEPTAERREGILNETYPLYLECGRQLSPQFWTVEKLADPPTEKAKAFKQLILREGVRLFPSERA
jgi:predicted nucleotidyltransferase